MRRSLLVLLVFTGVLLGVVPYGRTAEEGATEGRKETAADAVMESISEVALSLQARPQRIHALCQVSAGYAWLGNMAEAEKYFSKARELADELPYTYRDSVWKQAAGTFVMVEQYGYALDCARLMASPDERLSTVNQVTKSLVAVGPIERAEQAVRSLMGMAEEQDRIPLKVTALFHKAELEGRKENIQAADGIYREALKLAKDNLNLIDRGEQLALEKYVRTCPVEMVLSAVKGFYHGAERGRKLYEVGAICVEQEKAAGATKAFEESLAVLKQVSDVNARVLAQAELAEEHANDGRMDFARRLVQQASADLPNMADPVRKDQAGRALAVAQAAVGELEEALETTRGIGQDYERSLATIKVAGRLAEAGQIDRALQEVEQIPKDYERDQGYAQVAGATALHQDYERGIELLNEQVARRALRSSTLVNLARDLARKRKYGDALDAVAEIPAELGTRDLAAERVMEASLENLDEEDPDESLSVAARAIGLMTHRHRKRDPLRQLIRKCEEHGLYENAIDHLERLRAEAASAGHQAAALGGQARIYARMGRRAKAREVMEEFSDIVADQQRTAARWSMVKAALAELFSHEAGRELIPMIVSRLEEPLVESRARLWLLHNQLRADDLGADAQEQLERVVSLAEKTPGRLVQINLLRDVAHIADGGELELSERSRTALDRIAQAAVAAGEAAARKAAELTQRQGGIKLAFFIQTGCSACARVEPVVQEFATNRTDVEIRKYDVLEEGGSLLAGLGQKTGIPSEQIGSVPAIFSDQMGLVGNSIDPKTLKQLARTSTGRAPWDMPGVRGPSSLGFLVVVPAGLIDGFNPCAFTILIFFIAYLSYLKKNRKEIAIAGLVFTGAVFVTYLAVGLGLRGLLGLGSQVWTYFDLALQIIVAVLVLVLAILSFHDGLLCLRGKEKESRLKLPESWQSKARQMISKRARLGLTVGGTLVLGATVAAIEFPCTGQVYVFILSLLQTEPLRADALGWLVLYNVCFILPLLAVFVLTYYGLTSEKLTAWYREHMAKAKFGLAGFFLFLHVITLLLLTGVLGPGGGGFGTPSGERMGGGSGSAAREERMEDTGVAAPPGQRRPGQPSGQPSGQ